MAPPTAERPPVVTISRYPGTPGRELANVLGTRLGLEVLDRELIHRIAQDAHLRESAVTDLDEKERPLLTEWLSSFAADDHLSPYGYLSHLTAVVQAIGRLGGAVILGRGAHLILKEGEALRVMVVAPFEARVASVMQRHGVGTHEAERRIAAAEAARRAFIKQYFRAEPFDASRFDVVVNTAVLGVEGAADTVEAALAKLPTRKLQLATAG